MYSILWSIVFRIWHRNVCDVKPLWCCLDASDQSDDDRDHAEATEDDRDIEEQDEEDPYSEEERDDNDGQENRDAREEVVRIPGQSSDEREREDANEEEDENDDEFEEEEREVDNWHDDRMMDSDEGGMSLAGQAEENMSEQTDFEGFKRVSFLL